MPSAKARVPAVEGWLSVDGDAPRLLGNRCSACGAYFFPKATYACRNPDCQGREFEVLGLSRTGRLWSWTTNHYAPPHPYIAPDPFVPYTVAAVELSEERIVVLGQLAEGVDPTTLRAGDPVELDIAALYTDDDHEYMMWRWRPVESAR